MRSGSDAQTRGEAHRAEAVRLTAIERCRSEGYHEPVGLTVGEGSVAGNEHRESGVPSTTAIVLPQCRRRLPVVP